MTTDRAALGRLRHELHTPLNHIIGYSEMLLEEVEERGWADLTHDLHRVHEEGRRLLGQIDRFLDPSRGEAVDLERLPPELLTPLDSILVAVDALRTRATQVDGPDLLPDLERIRSAAQRLVTLVREGMSSAPAEVRGNYTTIATNVPGLRITEKLPAMAKVMNKIALVRSGAHNNDHHETATNWVLSGRFGSAFGDFPANRRTIRPSLGASDNKRR